MSSTTETPATTPATAPATGMRKNGQSELSRGFPTTLGLDLPTDPTLSPF